MFRKLRLALTGIVLVLASSLAGGALADQTLFDAQVEVASESARERSAAAAEGLREVLLRLTGSARVAEAERVRDALLANAERYVQQFGYDRLGESEGYLLLLRFDGPAVERRLAELEVPFWAADDRTRRLVWLAVDRAGQRELAGGDILPELQEDMRRAAQQQGLPVIFPLMDLEDRQQLSPSDVWGGFRSPIMQASARYGTEAVMVVRLSERTEDWSARWLQYRNGESLEWTSSGEDAQAALRAGMETGARRMAEQQARLRSVDEQRRVRLAFAGIDSLDDYGFLIRLLRAGRGVEGVRVLSADDQALLLDVLVDGDPSPLLRSLDGNARFAPLGGEDGPTADRAWRLQR
ncbi:MAG: DUF2066 domain-containing protein [Ectothiorhodospiraceae bacterium]|nr:DUF2066 domain-containing protein [Ectothiorhodospiraceae bacterium]